MQNRSRARHVIALAVAEYSIEVDYDVITPPAPPNHPRFIAKANSPSTARETTAKSKLRRGNGVTWSTSAGIVTAAGSRFYCDVSKAFSIHGGSSLLGMIDGLSYCHSDEP